MTTLPATCSLLVHATDGRGRAATGCSLSAWVALKEEEDEEEELDEFGAPRPSAPAVAAAAAAPAALGVAAAAEGTDQWVQCDRCRTWRIVPDAAWCANSPLLRITATSLCRCCHPHSRLCTRDVGSP